MFVLKGKGGPGSKFCFSLTFNVWWPYVSGFRNVLCDLSVFNGSHFVADSVRLGVPEMWEISLYGGGGQFLYGMTEV